MRVDSAFEKRPGLPISFGAATQIWAGEDADLSSSELFSDLADEFRINTFGRMANVVKSLRDLTPRAQRAVSKLSEFRFNSSPFDPGSRSH